MQNKQPAKRQSKKVGREGRHPSHKRYVAEKRWAKHKAVHILRFRRRHENYKTPETIGDDVKGFIARLR